MTSSLHPIVGGPRHFPQAEPSSSSHRHLAPGRVHDFRNVTSPLDEKQDFGPLLKRKLYAEKR